MSTPSEKNEELILAKQFFKGILEEEISEYKDKLSLNIEDFDITEEHLEKISKLNQISFKLTSLSVRLSNTLSDTFSLSKFLEKLCKKRQFTSFGFFIKYLKDELLNIFLDFLTKIGPNITKLKIHIKYDTLEKERDVTQKIISSLNQNTGLKVNEIDFSNLLFDDHTNIDLLEKFIQGKKLKILKLGGQRIYQSKILFDVSEIDTLIIQLSNLQFISSLPKTKLDLTSNNISKEGLEQISNMLSQPTCTLKKINLSNNFIGDDKCEILSEGISKNNSIVHLNLSMNNILDRGIKAIATGLLNNNSIKKVNFRNNYISNTGLISFCQILKETPFDKFVKIDFCVNTDLSDMGLLEYSKFLSEHHMIKYLLLSGKLSTGGEIDFFRNLKNLSNLKVISFHGMDLSSETMNFVNVILDNNKKLEKFNLNSSIKKIFHTGMSLLNSGLTKNTNIQTIHLGNSMIGDEGAEVLANALFNNLSIEEIFLEYNNIGLNGTKAICEKVFRKRSLKFLNLEHNNIDHTASVYIGKYLAEAYGIERLKLNSNKIGDEGCEFLAPGIEKNNTLQELNLENNEISNKGIKKLAAQIKNKKQFLSLIVSKNKITEIEDDFYELFKQLACVNIAENKLSSRALARIFHGTEENKLFKTVRVSDITKTEETFSIKTKNENLKHFDLSYNPINIPFVKQILMLKNLSFLKLQANQINNESIGLICKYILYYNTPIKILLLQGNLIEEEGAISIADLLLKNKTLKNLNLAENPIGHKGMNKIFDALKSNETLRNLLATNTGINDYSAENIYNMLKNNNTLRFLGLMSNNITNKGMDYILSALVVNKKLKGISVGGNKTDDQAFRNLEQYLKYNQSLMLLEIKTTRLTETFLNKFSKVFLHNKKLEELNLVNNHLNYEAFSKLIMYLENNNTINQVKILLNLPTPEERRKILSACPHIEFN
jgi:Ran GTPase-activating protein (RanGAP) involved in mRNA processing and transport